MPMPPDRYAELRRRQQEQPAPSPLQAVPLRESPARSSALAAELLAESAHRRLEAGELLLVSEEASLADLEAAAAPIVPAASLPAAAADEPLLADLAAPRLLCPRLYEIAGWSPPLPEHLKLLHGALRAGQVVGQTMLVGHVETWPERVEHLGRLREVVARAGQAGGAGAGSLIVAVAEADLAALPVADPGLAAEAATVAAAGRPPGLQIDRRHALAICRLALGPGAVVA